MPAGSTTNYTRWGALSVIFAQLHPSQSDKQNQKDGWHSLKEEEAQESEWPQGTEEKSEAEEQLQCNAGSK